MGLMQNFKSIFSNIKSNSTSEACCKPSESAIVAFIDIENFQSAQNIDVLLKKIKDLAQGKRLSMYAYADWKRIDPVIVNFLKDNFAEMINVHNGYGYYAHMRNSADIALSCDAVEFALSHQQTYNFILATGDSGFINLIYKLKEHKKHVTLISMQSRANKALIEEADEYHFIKEFGIGSQNATKLEYAEVKPAKEYSRLEKTVWAVLKNNENNHDHIQIVQRIFYAQAVQEELKIGLDVKVITKAIKTAYYRLDHKKTSMINLVNACVQRDYVKKDGLFYKAEY